MAAQEAEGHGSWLGLLFFAINFLLFVFLVVYFAGPPLRRFFSDRASTIHSNLAKSAKAFEEAETLARAASERIAALEGEVAELKRELEDNPVLAAAYPAAMGRGSPWGQDRIRLANGVVVEALGTGAKIRGRRNRAERPTLVVVDDPENDGHVTSSTQRRRSLA